MAEQLELNQPGWMDQALCRGEQREVFQRLVQIDYNGVLQGNPEGQREYLELKQIGRAVCGACCVTNACNEYAVEHRLPGMFAGLTQRDRRYAQRKAWRANQRAV